MQRCGKCGDYNTDESIFCNHCGNKLNNNCPSCRFPNLPQQNFCGNCGKQLLAETELPQSALQYGTNKPAPDPGEETTALGTLPRQEARVKAPDREKPVLEAYALASLELTGGEQADPEQLSSLRTRSLARMTEILTQAGARVQASRNGVLFIAFKNESSLEASLIRAVETCRNLLGQEIRMRDLVLKLKIGLDIENVQARNPLTSVVERSIALPGTLTLSEAAQRELGTRYEMEPIGPMPVGNQMMRFFRLRENPSAPVQNAPPASRTIPDPAPSLPSADQPAPGPETLWPMLPTRAEEPDTPPELPAYTPPEFGSFKPGHRPALPYEEAANALTGDLEAFLGESAELGRGRIAILCGGDGQGKTNIINMVRAGVDPENQRAIWLGGQNYRSFQVRQLPLLYWLDLFHNLLSLSFEGQAEPEVREQLQKFMGYVFEHDLPEDVRFFLEEFLSIRSIRPLPRDAQPNASRLEACLHVLFRRLTAKRPVILVVEELHLADAASLEILTRLLEQGLLNLPVYLIWTQLPDFYTQGALAAALQRCRHREITLNPLNAAEMERFLDEGPLGGRLSEFPVPLIDLLVRNAQGSPLYLEEALRLLHLKGILTPDPETHKLMTAEDIHPSDIELPGELATLIRARLGYLDEPPLYLLQLASVLGEKFSVAMLAGLSQMEEPVFNEGMALLFHHGYLVPDAVNTGRFRHGLIWQAVYGMLDEGHKVQMHQLVSEALDADFDKTMTVSPLLVAYHSENGQMPNRALQYWNLTGIFAAHAGSLTGMNMSMFRALDLLKRNDEPLHKQELALRMAENVGAFNLETDADFSAGLLQWVCFYRQESGNTEGLMEPLGLLTSAYETKGDLPQALQCLEKALSLLDEQNYPLEAASLLFHKLEHLYTLGRLQQAREVMERKLKPLLSRSSADASEIGLQARLIYTQILLGQCDANASKVVTEALEQARGLGLSELATALQLAWGQALLREGDYEACDREADSLLAAVESMHGTGMQGDWFLAQWGLLAMMYHCEMEDWESASQLILTVVSKAEAARDYLTWITAQAYAGLINARKGNAPEARRLLSQSVGMARDYRFASAALTGWRFTAELDLLQGNTKAALETAMQARKVATLPEIGNHTEAILLDVLCARIYLRMENVKAAGKILEGLWPKVIRTRINPLVAACAFEIGQLYKRMAQGAPPDLSKKHLMRSVEFCLKAKGIWLELRYMPGVRKVDAAMPRI